MERTNVMVMLTVALVAVVGLVTMFLQGSGRAPAELGEGENVAGQAVSRNVLNVPPRQAIRYGGTIKAHSCDADETCEVVGLMGDTATLRTVLRTNWVETAGITAAGGNIQLGVYSPYAPAISITSDGTSGPVTTLNGRVVSEEFEVVGTTKLNYLTVGRLSGGGNAYVCASSEGIVYRSLRPCV